MTSATTEPEVQPLSQAQEEVADSPVEVSQIESKVDDAKADKEAEHAETPSSPKGAAALAQANSGGFLAATREPTLKVSP
jgi:hypothetical protein